MEKIKNRKLRSYKRCISILLCVIGLFIGFHYITWACFTKKILSGNNNGDLVRLAYLPQLKHTRIFFDDLPGKHIEFSEFKGGNVDVLTIGDSFSNGIGGGKNRYYQDYLATRKNIDVVNVSPYKFDNVDPGNPFDTLMLFLNSGLLDDIRPKVVLLESAERFICSRSRKINFNITENRIKLLDYYNNGKAKISNILPATGFINDGNLKYYAYLFKRSNGANLINGVVIAKLDKKLFSAGDGATLLFLVDDLKGMPEDYGLCVDTLNEKLNILSSILNKKNIRLYFMLAVDKYNLYSKFIHNNPFPESKTFELLSKKDKSYYFIDTKKILFDELNQNGTSDLFYADDSHWSWKASELIFANVTVR